MFEPAFHPRRHPLRWRVASNCTLLLVAVACGGGNEPSPADATTGGPSGVGPASAAATSGASSGGAGTASATEATTATVSTEGGGLDSTVTTTGSASNTTGAATNTASSSGDVTAGTAASTSTSTTGSSTGGTSSTAATTTSGGTGGTGGPNDSTTTGSDSAAGCGETSGVEASAIFYVSPTGTATGSGSSFASAMDLSTALATVEAGQMLLLEPGTYTVPYREGNANTIELAKSGNSNAPISIVAANCGRAVVDFSFPEQSWVQDSYGFYVTGDYWYFKGIEVIRAGYQGVYVTGQHNTFENCAFHHNRNTGLEINKGGAYTTVINSDAYRNYDPKKFGGMADGFGPKQTQGPGNHLIGCRAWENSDDGFDTFDSPETVVIESSWAFRNGVDVWGYGGFDGNGNGFKLGGNQAVAHNRITNCVAFGNVVKGFDQNNNAGGLTILNCLSFQNGTNYGLGNPVNSGEQHYLRNNVSLSGSESIANADAANNSWDTGPTASASDFVSVDVSLATVARNADGSLPDTGLFRLVASSKLIDAGADVGLPYAGSAPDLGAFERE